jgi:hypothetical protein
MLSVHHFPWLLVERRGGAFGYAGEKQAAARGGANL